MLDEPAAATATRDSRVGLWALFAAFFRIGATSFGGSTAGWVHRDLVVRRRWIAEPTYLAALALGQALPGANGVKLSLLLGQHLGGPAGAIAAVIALLAGPFLIIIAIAAAYAGLASQPVLHAVLDGIAAAVIGLTFATGWRSLVQGAPGPIPLAIAAATVLCVGILRWPIIPVIAGLAPLSIGLSLMRARHRRHA